VAVAGESARFFIVPSDRSFLVTDVRNSDDTTQLTIPSGRSKIAIHVVTDDGTEVPGVRMVWRFNGQVIPQPVSDALSRQQMRRFQTDSSGYIVMDGMPSGLYEIWPVVNGKPLSMAANTLSLGAPVTLVAQDGSNLVEIKVQASNANAKP
jgi:hypothetical protein